MGLTIVSQFLWPTTWWFFWPLVIWTVIFMLHLMVIRTIDVDDEWVNERTDHLADNAFDFSHIETIRDQISKTTYGDAYGSEKDEKPPEK